MSHFFKKYISIVLLVLVLLLLAGYAVFVDRQLEEKSFVTPQIVRTKSHPKPKQNPVIVKESVYKQVATLDVGQRNLKLEFNEGELLVDVLNRQARQGLILLEGVEYSGLGFFVKSIGGLMPQEGQSLFLYVNGKKSDVGVSRILLHEGDVIRFAIEDNY